MPDSDKIQEFLDKLKPCIDKGELDACVDEATRLAEEMGIGSGKLYDLSTEFGNTEAHSYAYVLSLVMAQGFEGDGKAEAYYHAGLAAQSLEKLEEAEEQYKKSIEANPNIPEAHSNYGLMLDELERVEEAEEHYKKAIELDAEHANTHNNYALMLFNLKRYEEAEEHYKKAMEIYPKYAEAHSNFANLLNKQGKVKKAEEHYKKAIEADPNIPEVHSNYGFVLDELGKVEEAEEHYKKAIKLYPQFPEAHSNYGLMLYGLGRVNEAEEHYKKAIELNPNIPEVYLNYGLLLHKLNNVGKAEESYKKAIELNPNIPEVHGNYSLLLVELDRRNQALEEIKISSNLFKESECITDSHLAWAWFYESYADEYIKSKKYTESSEDIYKSGEKYLKSSKTVEGELKYAFELRGNEFKAKSFIRKEQRNLKELIENLKNASEFYKKASVCQVDGEQALCGACHGVMDVFSHVLTALDDIIKDGTPSINKDEWHNVLERSREVYLKIEAKDKAKKGTDLLDALEQLIKCVDELYEFKVRTSTVQGKRLTDCYNKLIDVSSKVEGGLKNITDPASDFIKDYAKEMGMPIYDGISIKSPDLTFYQKWIKPIRNVIWLIVLGIIASVIANRIYDLNLDIKLIELIKSLIP